MTLLIKDKAVVTDDWTLVRLDADPSAQQIVLPAGKIIVPLPVWQAQREALLARGDVGVWLASHERVETLTDDLARLALIAIDFPTFTDGRGYSMAYYLRSRLAYTGELRAIGDVLRDQLFAMQRVGFNAFSVRADRDIHDALKGLGDFSEVYQAAWDRQAPLFRRVSRETPHE